jgi:ferredoxin
LIDQNSSMSDVHIKFTREGLSGTVAVGSYLCDVMGRFGVRQQNDCDRQNEIHDCEVTIAHGADLLSEPTEAETEHFGPDRRTNLRRLACEAQIIKPGEIEIMTDEKAETAKEEQAKEKDKFQEEFAALPLEKKIANLLRMEAVTLGETVAYVVNSPMKVVEKVGDVIAEFGMKLEREAKKASRPKEKPPEPAADPSAAKAGTGRKPGGRAQKP